MTYFAISACLLGHRVRYDGGHKAWPFAAELAQRGVQWVPFCPEAECGLGVPREAMRLEGDPGQPTLVTLDTRIDHTTALQGWSETRVAAWRSLPIRGVLLKARSPSCGLSSVPVCNPTTGKPLALGAGLFARVCRNHLPHLPLEEADRLADWPAVAAWFATW